MFGSAYCIASSVFFDGVHSPAVHAWHAGIASWTPPQKLHYF